MWRWWCALHACRRSNGWGPEALSHQDLMAWAVLMRTRPRPVEIEMILLLDREWMARAASRARKEKR